VAELLGLENGVVLSEKDWLQLLASGMVGHDIVTMFESRKPSKAA
jgi:hypothetical protein